jgi:hypothetical protein
MFDADAGHVGRAPGRHQHVLKTRAALLAAFAHAQHDVVAILLGLDDLGLEVQVDFFAQHLPRLAQHHRVGQLGHAAAARVQAHAHAQAR